MIFLLAAAALCMGGIVAYLAREKGRSPLTWAIYGTVAAPIALPHILIVDPLDDDDGDVWAEIRTAIQTQSVNDQHPIMGKAGLQPMADAPAAPRREAPLRKAAAPGVRRDPQQPYLNPAPKPDIKAELTPDLWNEPISEPRYEPRPDVRAEPKNEMFADKPHQPTPGQRAEPSFGAAPRTDSHPARAAANDFTLNASDRIRSTQPAQPPRHGGEMRMRAPLSTDPDADRAQNRPIAGRLFALGAVAVAIAAGIFVLGPTLARFVPPEFAFWAKPEVRDVKNTAPTGITPSGSAPGAAPGAAPGMTASQALPGGNTTVDDAREVGAARFGGPIKSDTKAPAYTGSSATPTDLAAATRGMKPVDVPEETKSAPKTETKAEPKSEAPKAVAKSEPKAVTPPPARAEAPKEAPKAEPKAAAVAPAPKAEPKRVETAKAEPPKVEAPKAAPKAAPPEDFLSMVNKAITTGTAPQPAQTNTESERIEQVGAANDLVQSVQVKLRERGYDPGTIDGRTNPKTVQAIRDYQQSIGMPADGLIDVALMERLGVVGKRLQFPTGR